MKKITNKDIAKLAGVSPSAVSIVMNGRAGVSDKTRNRILRIVKEHNYITGATSAELIQKRSRYIAVLFRTDALFDDQIFYSEMVIDAMVGCKERDYYVVPTFVTGEPGVIELPYALRNRDVDGALICGDQEPGIYNELKSIGIPFVVLDSSRHNEHVSAVLVDYESAAYTATKHLIDLGHRDIAYLGNGALHDFNVLALSGFQRAMGEYDLSIKPDRIRIDLGSDESMKQCVDQVFSGKEKPTAVFCTVDIYAISIIRYLHTIGIQVPQDVSIISMDDILVSRYTIPSLSSMHVDRKKMVKIGLRMLEQEIKGELTQREMLVSPDLIIRESTAKR